MEQKENSKMLKKYQDGGNMTTKQQAYFFELLEKLGYDKEEAKEHAKQKYNKNHFLDLTSKEIGELIEILEKECFSDTKTPDGFPAEYKIWDTEERIMRYGSDALNQLDFQPHSPHNRWILMWYTGRKDDRGSKIYDYDIVLSALNKKYLIQYSTKDCAWVGFDPISGETMFLSSFGKLTNLGSQFEGN